MTIYSTVIVIATVLSCMSLTTSGWLFPNLLSNKNTNSKCCCNENESTRRNFLAIAVSIGGSITIQNNKANAACLPGDLSKECIGVYKVPIDDAILPYVGTPEKLKQFAPDLKYVPPIKPPASVSVAQEMLETQRLAADDIKQVVSEGRLEEAGIKVLNLLPKLTSSGKLIVDSMEVTLIGNPSTAIDEIKFSRLKDQLNMALGLWGECDVMIGQGLRGEMGSLTFAQIQILSSLRDATAALDDFLASIASLSKEKTL